MKYGLIGALVVVGVMGGLYLVDKHLYLSPLTNWLILLAYIPFMWWALTDFMAKHPDTTEIRTMIRPGFLTFILINLGFYLLLYSLFLYDKELLAITTNQEIQFFEGEIARGTGDPQKANELREKIQYLQSNGMQVALGPILMQMCTGAIGGFGLSALLAYLFQSRSK